VHAAEIGPEWATNSKSKRTTIAATLEQRPSHKLARLVQSATGLKVSRWLLHLSKSRGLKRTTGQSLRLHNHSLTLHKIQFAPLERLSTCFGYMIRIASFILR
jgi:hypothetical protein